MRSSALAACMLVAGAGLAPAEGLAPADLARGYHFWNGDRSDARFGTFEYGMSGEGSGFYANFGHMS